MADASNLSPPSRGPQGPEGTSVLSLHTRWFPVLSLPPHARLERQTAETFLWLLSLCGDKESGIHTSPEKGRVRLEVRLHGILEALDPMTPAMYEQLLRRVKFVSKLKLNVTNVPQDGQYTFDVKQSDGVVNTVNVRVATLPSRFGESMTLRLLDPKRGILPLTSLGFPEEMQKQLEQLARMPYGLVLVTGPTGSGKTTTLYALLSTLIGTKRNIITLEDPVEYEIGGIVQSEIDSDHGFTFASGLRSVLRHDPNVVLVGEIRDLETAQTAVDAALTGHLVLSTLHTNSAIEAIPRLLSMGVSPYTFAPSLRAVLAQRLVRYLSDDCRKQGASCDPASPASYGGRMVLPELLTVDEEIRSLILAQEDEAAIRAAAKKKGFSTMREWGDDLVKSGITTKQEVERVAL
ncbi:MAG: general secretion pathway protein E [Candidatus Peregrinibacteria bacterium Gr01-1014_25]|nr:MAG: general secretion pathway protein E [Candidatus Peregrinibacteria bacterium Gr01-1014_25]